MEDEGIEYGRTRSTRDIGSSAHAAPKAAPKKASPKPAPKKAPPKPAPKAAPKKSPIPTNYARQVLQLASKDRPCIILSRGCANESSTRHASARRLQYFHRYFDKTSKLTEEEKIMKFPTLFPGEWGSCAIVGNGDNMIKGQYGKEIDDHDFVARYNVITKPYAKAVGTKVSGMFDKFNYRIGPHKPDRMPTMVSQNPRHASFCSFSSLLPLSLRPDRDRVTPPPPSRESFDRFAHISLCCLSVPLSTTCIPSGLPPT